MGLAIYLVLIVFVVAAITLDLQMRWRFGKAIRYEPRHYAGRG